MADILFAGLVAATFVALAIARAGLAWWAVAAGVAVLLSLSGVLDRGVPAREIGLLGGVAIVMAGLLAILSLRPVRRLLVTRPAFGLVRSVLPKVSATEAQALAAGTIGFDAEIFSGKPDWDKLRGLPGIELSKEEQAFLDGPTQELCRRIDDWTIRLEKTIPEDIWTFVRANGFLGMLISKAHGGLGFSAQAQSLIIGKIASRSPDVATIVMVPNSLGPGELVERYGTPEQKRHHLPRLASGLDIPCFALTGPTSGSDAAGMRDVGILEKGVYAGQPTLGIRLTWDKRYITLGPRATLVGLAFRLLDPGNLLGRGEDIGITVALIPADHPGVEIGRRHRPSGTAFPNGPTSGRDVFIPIDWVVGGQPMVGQGWRMLMECLAAGRAVSLPSSAAAAAKAMLHQTTAYARVRRQFGLPIGRMDGVEEAIVRIAEAAYVTEAARAVTAAMVTRGERPAVISALMKYQTTERMRDAVMAAMDVHGGKAICDGPSNPVMAAYQMMPIAITVEGANILTRTLITFAQGALRSHPYLFQEIEAARDTDRRRGFLAFETAFEGHVGFAVSNVTRALLHNLTFGALAAAPDDVYTRARWYRQLSRQSANFALLADVMVVTLGGGLKTHQRLSGRMADALSEIYLAAACLKRFEDDGRPQADRALMELSVRNALYRCQRALAAVIDNFPSAVLRFVLARIVFPFGEPYRAASDTLGRQAAAAIAVPGEARDRLTRHIFVSRDPSEAAGRTELAFALAVAAEDAERKLERAVKAGTVRRYHGHDWLNEAVDAGILTEAEAKRLRDLEALTAQVIAVDDFEPADVRSAHAGAPPVANDRLPRAAAAE
ncbi:MAG: acyl-CoA dehydrogenase [Hyphomicrobiaceae bacterium]|nr:acyl-CoA dehydrogenase [Hyphomicrobiaceae bacterium]